ncbi:hypothetical protein F2Q69_00052903 [Brassica cretica]|uniref:Uncharacterized protein n=1 Tax=Brassica cretica TaxID=69181 RepID=A0A8S9MYB5_BRACR|nr:hypothetical protein F2Q69_00052903 [Brassica cretica]
MTMTTNEQEKQFPASPREVELKNQISPLQSQVTELNKAQDATVENPELLTEVQVLKNTLGEHSKLIEQSTEKLSQLPPPLNGDTAAGTDATRRNRVNLIDDFDSEMETDEETPKGVTAKKSSVTASGCSLSISTPSGLWWKELWEWLLRSKEAIPIHTPILPILTRLHS